MAGSRHDTRSAAIYADAIVFFVFVLFGCGYIIVGKLEGFGQVWVTFLPVLLMIAYALMIWLARGLRLRDDQAGDNLYYMGFLFTLASLGVSLYQFTAEGGAETIVRNFGIAIASTIAGVALRVVFNQMRRDPVDVERISRLELADAARRVRRELDATVLEMTNFRRVTQQVVAEGFEETKKHIDEVSGKLLNSFIQLEAQTTGPMEKASQSAGESLASMSGRLSSGIEAAGAKLSEEADRLARSTHSITATLDTLSVRLRGVQAPEQVIEVKVSPVVEAFRLAVQDLARQQEEGSAKIDAALENIRSTATQLSEAIEALKTTAGDQNRGMADAAAAVKDSATHSRDAALRIETSLAALSEAQRNSSRRADERFEQHLSKLSTTIERLSADLARARTEGVNGALP